MNENIEACLKNRHHHTPGGTLSILLGDCDTGTIVSPPLGNIFRIHFRSYMTTAVDVLGIVV